MTAQELGTWGEKYVIARLIERGWLAVSGRKGQESDIVATNQERRIQIEVKAARMGHDKKWRATLIKENATCHHKADVVILVCQNVTEITFFIIPVKDIFNRRHIAITSNPRTYNGVWSKYRHESLVV